MSLDKIIGGGLLAGKKTYLVAIGVVVTAVLSYLQGDSTLVQMLEAVFLGGGLAFLRSGVAKTNGQ